VQTLLADAFKRNDSEPSNASTPESGSATPIASILKVMPAKRYIGSFGVAGWSTKSGIGLLQHDESVTVERQKIQPKKAKGIKRVLNLKKQDVLVRFTNDRGDEVGRLENESAAWISTLMDQKICSFEGKVVYVPDRIKTGETIYLQLRAYFVRSAFDKRRFTKPDNNREINLFEQQESSDERDLRLRQVGLVKLFEAISLHPTRENETTAKHKRQGLLQAAEQADSEQKPKAKNATTATTATTVEPASSPPSDEAEEGEELEQDQLDSLYKKAQSFDFDTPVMEPADTFAMNLRKYQKQALHWMVGKEKHESADHKDESMHPLWEEYAWPIQDADSMPVPSIEDQPMFYVNPYSGELSLEFPKQEQNCLGGILADGMWP
jgi:DNA repair protein RAD5